MRFKMPFFHCVIPFGSDSLNSLSDVSKLLIGKIRSGGCGMMYLIVLRTIWVYPMWVS